MIYGGYHNSSPRLPALALLLLAGLYLLVGVTGHDPWKSEDAIHIGIAYGFLMDGNWLFPQIAGEPWPHTAPLYHWVAALLGRVFGDLLAFHEAARLATTLFGALFLFALTQAARAFHGVHAGQSAPLLAMGTLGLLLPMHEAQPAIAGLAFAALAYWGAALILQGRRVGTLLLGSGIGLAFPAHGLVGLIMAITVLAAPTFQRDGKSLALALLIAIPLIAAWPLLLFLHAPELWHSWWQNEIAEATSARGLPTLRHLEQMAWAAWPVLPLAFWSIWLHRHKAASLAMPLLGLLIPLAWFLTGSSRSLALMPLLLPLILLAAAGVDRLRRGAANAFDWFGIMTFSFFAGLIWLGASAQALDWPPRIAYNFEKLAPGHDVHYSLPALGFAGALTLAWVLSWRISRASWRGSLHWAGGITLLWALVATLWLSWVDHGTSYRPLAVSLRAALPEAVDCIERRGISAAQRASLDYFVGLRTAPPVRSGDPSCGWRLTIDDRGRAPPAGWASHWQGQRPSDRRESWYLERREPKPSESSPGNT
jgi:4-amino-4-deoxy-L-arabinose transferase-like glycosyltransferase